MAQFSQVREENFQLTEQLRSEQTRTGDIEHSLKVRHRGQSPKYNSVDFMVPRECQGDNSYMYNVYIYNKSCFVLSTRG